MINPPTVHDDDEVEITIRGRIRQQWRNDTHTPYGGDVWQLTNNYGDLQMIYTRNHLIRNIKLITQRLVRDDIYRGHELGGAPLDTVVENVHNHEIHIRGYADCWLVPGTDTPWLLRPESSYRVLRVGTGQEDSHGL